MRITDQQALMMFQIVHGARNYSMIAGFTIDDRLKLINQIIKQQDNRLIDLETGNFVEKEEKDSKPPED